MPKKAAQTSEPKFPYTTEPKALRRLLSEIPKRPKPPKISMEILKSWSVSNNNNARTAINVLKKLGLVGPSGEPTPTYTAFMDKGKGPTVLGNVVKETYKALFDASHAPQKESDEQLKSLFNIHSGGGTDSMRLQIQTFKALCEYANFESSPNQASSGTPAGLGTASAAGQDPQIIPPIRLDLHIHLPENKTSRDYEAIIQDIAKYIYGRDIESS